MSQAFSPGLIAIIGSGELSDSVAETHRLLMARLSEPPRPVFIDTPAGFETNVVQIAHKAQVYFRRNFNLDLALAHYPAPAVPPTTVAKAVAAVQRANYLFAGPGSPTYAVRVWRDSQPWRAVLDRWRTGAALVLASAATLTLGRYTLPVYEIYKAGFDLHWTEGLNVLDWLGPVAVVPHWNNGSGEQHDTRFCFMGAARFAQLEAQLPPETLIVGVDEYTALVLDPQRREGQVLGAGEVTLRHGGRQVVFGKGDCFNLDDALRQGQRETLVAPTVEETPAETETADEAEAVADILAVQEAVREAVGQSDFQTAVQGLVTRSLMAGAGLEQGRPDRGEQAVQSLQVVLPLLETIAAPLDRMDKLETERGVLVDLLVQARSELRRARQFALADGLRDQLGALGYSLEDAPGGTTWRRQNGQIARMR